MCRYVIFHQRAGRRAFLSNNLRLMVGQRGVCKHEILHIIYCTYKYISADFRESGLNLTCAILSSPPSLSRIFPIIQQVIPHLPNGSLSSDP
jgi:hypothetical protein